VSPSDGEPAPWTGIVVDEQGAPVVGARVTVGAEFEGPTVQSVRTGDDGTFSVAAPSGSNRDLHVRAPGFCTHAMWPWPRPGEHTFRIQLVRDLTISGVVVDARTGAPLPGARLFMSSAAGSPTAHFVARTDQDGWFLFTAHSSDLQLVDVVEFAEVGYIPTRPQRVRASLEELRIPVERRVPLRVRIVDPDGAPVFATVRARGASGSWWHNDVRGMGEMYEVDREPGVPVDVWVVPFGTALERGCCRRVVEGLLPREEPHVVRLEVGPRVSLRVLDAEGRVADTALEAWILPLGGHDELQRIGCEPQGAGHLVSREPLPRGARLRVHVATLDGAMAAVHEGVLPASGEITLRLDAGHTLRGAIVLSDIVSPGELTEERLLDLRVCTRAAAQVAGEAIERHAPIAMDGTFSIGGLADVPHELLVVDWAEAAVYEVRRDVRPGLQVLHGLRATRKDATLKGLLLDEHGLRVTEGHVTVDTGDASEPVGRGELEDGFELHGLRPGPVRLRYVHGDLSVPLGEVTAPADDLILRLPAGAGAGGR
jgi:hypothetical protein